MPVASRFKKRLLAATGVKPSSDSDSDERSKPTFVDTKQPSPKPSLLGNLPSQCKRKRRTSSLSATPSSKRQLRPSDKSSPRQTPPIDVAGPKPGDSPTITLKESARYQHETKVRVLRTKKLRGMMEYYARGLNVARDQLRFVTHDGQRIKDEQTAESLELEDGDIIDVLKEQQGGRVAECN